MLTRRSRSGRLRSDRRRADDRHRDVCDLACNCALHVCLMVLSGVLDAFSFWLGLLMLDVFNVVVIMSARDAQHSLSFVAGKTVVCREQNDP